MLKIYNNDSNKIRCKVMLIKRKSIGRKKERKYEAIYKFNDFNSLLFFD